MDVETWPAAAAADIISGSMPRPERDVCEAKAPMANQASDEARKLTAFWAT